MSLIITRGLLPGSHSAPRNASVYFHFFRRSSCLSASDQTPVLQHSASYDVQPNYGHLKVSGNLSCIVRPDMEHQCGTVCSLRVFSPPSCSAQVSVSQSPDKSVLQIEGTSSADFKGQFCEVLVPVKYDVTAAVEDSANLAVHQLQNSFTNLETHTGAVILNKLQSLDVSYQTSSGPLNIMGKLLSSLSCKGKCINISGETVQADTVSIEAAEVNAKLDSLHSNTFTLEAEEASLVLKNITTRSNFNIGKANFEIGNISGSLRWLLKQGSLRIAVPEIAEDSSIEVGEGVCSIGCPSSYKFGIDLAAENLSIHEEFTNLTQSSEIHELSKRNLLTAKIACENSTLKIVVHNGKLILVPWMWPFTAHDVSI